MVDDVSLYTTWIKMVLNVLDTDHKAIDVFSYLSWRKNIQSVKWLDNEHAQRRRHVTRARLYSRVLLWMVDQTMLTQTSCTAVLAEEGTLQSHIHTWVFTTWVPTQG